MALLLSSNQTEQGPSVTQLRMAEYGARHRELWRRAFQFSLFFLDVLIITALVWSYVEYAAGLPRHRALEASLSASYIDFRAYHARHRTLPLDVVSHAAVATAEGRGDVVAVIKNPNREWAARAVPYQFVTAGGRSARQTTFVLPGETRIVAAFNQTVYPGEVARLELGEVAWHKVMPGTVRPAALRAQQFHYSQFATGATGLDFTAANDTPYSFWEVPLIVAAYDAEGIVGVHALVVEQWKSGETRSLSLTWPDALPFVRETAVDFAVDVLDPAVFMPLSGTVVPYPGF